MTARGICWLDGEIRPLDQARIPVTDHGLLYGDGVFEGIRFYHGRPFLLAEHLTRLADSARAIALRLPRPLVEIADIVHAVVTAYPGPAGYLRLIITRGPGPLGIDPTPCQTPNLIVIAAPLALVDEARRQRGVRLVTAATRRLGPDGLDPRIKSLNYLNAVLARLEAHHAGADEAVLLNARGHLAEGTADNLFLARDGVLLTPPVTDGALAGITRSLLLTLAAELGIPAREQSLAPYDLYTADECLLTGTGAELIPVREVDGRSLPHCPGPLTTRLMAAFRARIDALARPAG